MSKTAGHGRVGAGRRLELVVAGSVVNSTFMNSPRGVAVLDAYAYVTGLHSASLAVVDVSNPASPVVVGGLIDSPLMSGPSAVVVLGSYAYVAGSHSNSLAVVDVSNPASPVLVGGIKNATYMNGATGVAVVGSYAYVAGKWSNSLVVVDVSNPALPAIVGAAVSDTNLNNAYAVTTLGSYAYVTASAYRSLAVVDVSNPASPVVVGAVMSSEYMKTPYAVAVLGSYAYVTGWFSNSLAVVDVSNPTSPLVVGGVIDSTLLNNAASVAVIGSHAYVVGWQYCSLAVVDVSNPAFPSVAGGITDLKDTLTPSALAMQGSYAYVTGYNSQSLTVVDVSNPLWSPPPSPPPPPSQPPLPYLPPPLPYLPPPLPYLPPPPQPQSSSSPPSPTIVIVLSVLGGLIFLGSMLLLIQWRARKRLASRVERYIEMQAIAANDAKQMVVWLEDADAPVDARNYITTTMHAIESSSAQRLVSTKMHGDVQELRMDEAQQAALGVQNLMNVDVDANRAQMALGLKAIEAEFKAFRDAATSQGTSIAVTPWWATPEIAEEAYECMSYCLHERAGSSDKLFPNSPYPRDCDASGVRADRISKTSGRGMLLIDFCIHESSLAAKLKESHVAAIRIYSTAAFKVLNGPLREKSWTASHPLPVTVSFLAEAIGQLRAAHAPQAEQQDKVFDIWRGMKNLEATERFMKSGGTETSPMSTTKDLKVALAYAMATKSLLFKLRTTSFMARGANIEFLSAFPAEAEILFPPLTYLKPTGKTELIQLAECAVNVCEVEPHLGRL